VAVVVIGIVLAVVGVVSVAIVGALFVWAARKDGEENDAVHASSTPFRDELSYRNPIRRPTRRGTRRGR
jgi:hypothetical protein